MNQETLHQLLASRRPGDETSDVDVITALASLQNDSAALAAAEADLRMDEAIRAALREAVPVPAELAGRLKALVPASEGKIVAFARRPVLGWLAATAAAIVTGAYVLNRRNSSVVEGKPTLAARPLYFDHWKNTAAAWVQNPKLAQQSPNLAVLLAHLAQQQAIVPKDLPATLASFPTLGCQTLTIDGQAISVVCFLHQDHVYHTFVTQAKGIDAAAEFFHAAGPKIWNEQGWNFATWQAAEQGFMLLTQAPEAELRGVLS